MKLRLCILFAAAVLFAVGACDKREDTTVSKKPAETGPLIEAPPITEGLTEVDPETGVTIDIPVEIRQKWLSVVIVVDDKKENKQEEFTIDIGAEFRIPDSDLTVKVGHFIPEFRLDNNTITSLSSEPKNPSVGIAVMQKGEKIYPERGKWGWLHGNFPKIHPFQHERYALTLKGARYRDDNPHQGIDVKSTN
jgi:hypothetical protein